MTSIRSSNKPNHAPEPNLNPALNNFPYTHVVFDWNGTLLNDAPLMHEAFNVNAETHRYASVPLEWWQEQETRPFRQYYNALRSLCGETHMTDEEYLAAGDAWRAAYRELTRDIALAPGALELMQVLQKNDTTFSVCSMHRHSEVVREIERLNIAGHFTLVSGMDEGSVAETKSDHLQKHLARLQEIGVVRDARWVVMIGDIVDDATAASKNNIDALLVASGEDSLGRLKAANVPVFPDLFAIKDALADTADQPQCH